MNKCGNKQIGFIFKGVSKQTNYESLVKKKVKLQLEIKFSPHKHIFIKLKEK